MFFMSLVYTGFVGTGGFGGQSGHWPLGHLLARLEALEQCHVGVDCGLVAAVFAEPIDVELHHLDEHIAVGEVELVAR
jgi:hypothetical protein